jgi:metal-responsive CopG/Arc/MetJ family transcriptional regulator
MQEQTMRTLVDIDARAIKALDELARKERTSRAALIRAAVDAFLARHAARPKDHAFGLWGNHRIDGLAYQEQVRGEW